jgi:phage terminase large subunit
MVAPHDIEVHEFSHGMTRKEMARRQGVNFETAVRGSLADGIEMTRQILSACYFDEARCSDGLHSLRTYIRGKDSVTGDWKDQPKKGKANHGADAFRTMGVMHDFDFNSGYASDLPPIPVTPPSAWT